MSRKELANKIEDLLDIAWNSPFDYLRAEAKIEVQYYANKYKELYGKEYRRVCEKNE